MNQKFKRLRENKRLKILNAAFKEFIDKGYDLASTNIIVKNAEISKGALFDYFETKKGMYLYLLDYTEKIVEQIYLQINYQETDLFERLKDIGRIKFKLMKNVPLAFDFLKSFSKETSIIIQKIKANKKSKSIEKGLTEIYKNIDYKKFREDLDLEKILKTINFTILGMSEEENNKVDSFGNVKEDVLIYFDKYYDFFKKAFYKKEFQ
ncbi:MAG: TetR/AcrR family transcriptional regulator [Candidatus Izimaplasma sp.]|nr:TetR/AcrR family transcriptional regulator [Candidatus Izimaplasma bacterium]